jgi:hypothetical protein
MSSDLRLQMSLRIEDVRRCNRQYLESLLKRFFDAFNRGEVRLADFFLPEDRWLWWRDPDHMQEPVPYAQLESYLRGLHDGGIVLQLESLSFNGYRGSPPEGADFGFHTVGASGSRGSGKGFIDCASGLLAVVTIERW